MTKPAVFLDRDGVINRDSGYVFQTQQLEILPGTKSALCALRNAGYLLVVVTNQSGIARGYYQQEDMTRVHQCIDMLLGHLAKPDAYYFCPHHPEGTVRELATQCACRKPGVGMFEQAARDWPIDRSKSFMIGDKESDIEAAWAWGISALQVMGAYPLTRGNTLIFPSVSEAAEHILQSSSQK